MRYRTRLLAAMFASVLSVAVVALLEERREFEASIAALEREQATLATAIGTDVENRLSRLQDTLSQSPPELLIPKLLGGAVRLERAGSRMLLIARPGSNGLLTSDGSLVTSPELWQSIHARKPSAVLTREVAARFGLPQRIAIAGIANVPSPIGTWKVVVLGSGERLREREERAQQRFLLALTVVAALVAGFGFHALTRQRKQLEVARELEVSALVRDRDRLLARNDKMTTIAALSGGVAHELATPLGIIVARVEQVLVVVEGQARATAALRVVLDQVQRIQRVIQGFLSLARNEAPSFARGRPESIVTLATEQVRHRFAQAGVWLNVHVLLAAPDISCDAPMLEQALVNLLLNACDVTPRGSHVTARVEAESERVRFVVEDEGEGISPEAAERALEPFFTTKPRGRGTGLGLAIAHEIVSHHGGTLRLDRRDGAPGTRAVLELPARADGNLPT